MSLTNKDAAPYLLTPRQRVCHAEQIKYTEGNVRTQDSCHFTLTFRKGEEKPYLVLDLGRNSPGGYPVFTVKSHRGKPVLRIAYSDIYDYLLDPEHRDTGDFLRGCTKYLGVELPVLPANPDRFEQYSIGRDGRYQHPLLQGQQRFVLLTLDTPGEVEFEDFYIYYTSDMTPNDGHFLCSSNNLNQLWYSSTYTTQIASFDNSQAWEVLNDTLLIRALTKGNPAGIWNNGLDWSDYTFDFTAQLSLNPACTSGIGWMVRAQDQDNGYVLRLTLDGTLRWYLRRGGVNTMAGQRNLGSALPDNTPLEFSTAVSGNILTVILNGEILLQWKDNTFSHGTIGFIQTTESWAMVGQLRVTSGDTVLLEDNFTKGLREDYIFTRSIPFLADGAKRDRLPWSGDLDWAGRNIYYAFKDAPYMWGSLLLFAHHQTPEGYIWGTCYPENTNPIPSGEYGYYESDIFSAWFVPSLWDYLLFTGKTEQVRTLLPNAKADLEYLWQYVEADGLFFQRYATSKGLWDHTLNDIGRYSYNNIIMYDTMAKGALLGRACGDEEMAKTMESRAEFLRQGIMAKLWNEEKGFFPKGTREPQFCNMANALALAVGLPSQEQAERLVKNMQQWLKTDLAMGKIISLFIRGCFRYGFDDVAMETLTGRTGTLHVEGRDVHVDWLSSIFDDNGPATTTECMVWPPVTIDTDTEGKHWFDRSHPDTAVAHLLTGFVLGVEPMTCGYQHFRVEPHCCGLGFAHGLVPTPQGNIEVLWRMEEDGFSLELQCPAQTLPSISARYIKAPVKSITINGKTANL